MNRFHTSTVFIILIALGAGMALEGLLRWLALGFLLIVYLVVITLGISMLKLNYFVKAVCRGDVTVRRVSLTFDDGPDPEATPAILKILEKHGIKAAFFPIGKNVRKHPEIIKEIDQQGHILGNHSYRHAWWTNFLLGGSLEREIGRAQETIRAVIGKVPAYFRPPMGLSNPHLPKKLSKHGLSVVGWDIRPFDTKAGNEKVIKRVLNKVRNGSIILLHDVGECPAGLTRMVDELVTEIKAQRYVFSELEELIGIEAYQTLGKVPAQETSIFVQAWQESKAGGKGGRLRRFLAHILASTPYIREAIKEKVDLNVFKERPSPVFLCGIGLVLFSYVLGWPMVGLFSVLAVCLQTPALFVVGPALYGLSIIVFMVGIYLAGRDSIKYADTMLRWGLRKIVERIRN